ncbi:MULTISPECIES: RNA-guided endonuclease InsQ/TnpB family protein [Argonema]|uniref:RNA-guided endonuclease InsQ/TnpB family protein n=1 Tax=Argonema TaxID=2942761 RepID=UPI002011871B|nr:MULTISPECIES: transposase [Argonema]MCL1466248.1 transposase [Argonema galeatum A003/A1]MCL1475118.1 transposase [Argonema antarcticum A004/B2]
MFAIKRELKVNNKERSLMRGIAGFKRFVYNYGLDLIAASWDWEDVRGSDAKRIDTIKKVFTQVTMKKPEYAWMNKYPSTVYQSAFIALKKSFDSWRKGLTDFPKKKCKKKGDSFTVYKTSGIYPEKGKPALPFTNRVVIDAGKIIKLPGLKTFRLKEKIDFTCSSQTFTVDRIADKWFVSLAVDAQKIPPIYHPVQKVGVDLGVKCLATVSDGTCYAMPATTKRAKTKLSKLLLHNRNKKHGHKKLGIGASNNAKRYYIELAREYARISNIRRDTIQKMTTDLSRRVYCIRIEDLNVSGMMANHKLASAVTDNCFYEVRRQLIYKQAHYGTKVEIVDRWYPSSKMCSNCRHIQPMKLSERVFRCQKCNHVQDRDENASVNLENAPDNVVRSARPELTPVDKKWPTTLVEAGRKR